MSAHARLTVTLCAFVEVMHPWLNFSWGACAHACVYMYISSCRWGGYISVEAVVVWSPRCPVYMYQGEDTEPYFASQVVTQNICQINALQCYLKCETCMSRQFAVITGVFFFFLFFSSTNSKILNKTKISHHRLPSCLHLRSSWPMPGPSWTTGGGSSSGTVYVTVVPGA